MSAPVEHRRLLLDRIKAAGDDGATVRDLTLPLDLPDNVTAGRKVFRWRVAR